MDITKSTKICMKKKGLNQERLAEHLGITPSAVSGIMRRGSCNSDTIEKLADVFGMKASEFIAEGEQ